MSDATEAKTPLPSFVRRIMLEPSGCWTVRTSGKIRPMVGVNGKPVKAVRFLYRMFRGPIPDGLVLDHVVCDNTVCCNPWHTEPRTQRENVLRSTIAPAGINARKTHCPLGHEYSELNTRRDKNGHRHCRTCEHQRNLRRPFR